MNFSTSLIITTYNRPDALKAVLDSVACQQILPLEVLVADDGSQADTTQLLQTTQLPCPLHHVWQEDQGFRAASARNRAIAEAQGKYVIFIDGDCVLRPNFISAHQQLAAPGWFVSGHRLLLSETYSQRVLQQLIAIQHLSSATWVKNRFQGNINRILPLITLPDGRWRCYNPTRWEAARTCNLAVWRDDLLRINGFDERFNGWGYEDSDLAVRLIRAGVRSKDGRYATGIFHLWHQENDRSRERDNHALLQNSLNGKHIRAEIGLDQLTP